MRKLRFEKFGQEKFWDIWNFFSSEGVKIWMVDLDFEFLSRNSGPRGSRDRSRVDRGRGRGRGRGRIGPRVEKVRKVRKSQILTFLTQNFIHFSWILGHFEYFHFSGGPKLARFASVWSVGDFGKNG